MWWRGSRALDACRDRLQIVHPGNIANPDGLPREELEPEEILERTRHSLAPTVRRHPPQRRVVHEDLAVAGVVHLREQLHERRLAGAVLADDRDHQAGGRLARA